MSKTAQEVSLIAESRFVTEIPEKQDGWGMFYIKGEISFAVTGLLSPILERMAEAKISICTVSTFNTDYVFFENKHKNSVIDLLKNNYTIEEESQKTSG
ncbi:MAG: ACT domain-containing protein [Verrucomicrobiota bacterium]|nr:ACT domain-containing protein [Verrucomicrobiota bacterium]